MSYKICKGCGAKNDISEAFCNECFGTDFIENEKIQNNDKTIIDNIFILKHLDFEIQVRNNDILGREAVGGEVLKEFKTVSRKHLKITFDKNWYIEDLNSTNGSYLNDIKLSSNQKYIIKNGDILSLSSKVKFKIMI